MSNYPNIEYSQLQNQRDIVVEDVVEIKPSLSSLYLSQSQVQPASPYRQRQQQQSPVKQYLPDQDLSLKEGKEYLTTSKLYQTKLLSNQPPETLLSHKVLGYYQPIQLDPDFFKNQMAKTEPLEYVKEQESLINARCCCGFGVLLLVGAVVLGAEAPDFEYPFIFLMLAAFTLLVLSCVSGCFSRTKDIIRFDRVKDKFYRQRMSYFNPKGGVKKKISDIVGIQLVKKEIIIHVQEEVKTESTQYQGNSKDLHKYDDHETHYQFWLIFKDDKYMQLWDLTGSNGKYQIESTYKQIFEYLGTQENQVWVHKYGEKDEKRYRKVYV